MKFRFRLYEYFIISNFSESSGILRKLQKVINYRNSKTAEVSNAPSAANKFMKKNIILLIFVFSATFALRAQSGTPEPTPKHSGESLASTSASNKLSARFVDISSFDGSESGLFNAPIMDSITAPTKTAQRAYLRTSIYSKYKEFKWGFGGLNILGIVLTVIGVIALLGSVLMLVNTEYLRFFGLFLGGGLIITLAFFIIDFHRLFTPNCEIYFDNATNSPATVLLDGRELFTLEPKSYSRVEFWKRLDYYVPTATVKIVILSADGSEKEQAEEKIEGYGQKYLYNIGKANQYWKESVSYSERK